MVRPLKGTGPGDTGQAAQVTLVRAACIRLLPHLADRGAGRWGAGR